MKSKSSGTPREKRLANKARHREKHRAALAAKQRARYNAHRDENLVKMAKYQKEHKEERRAYAQNYKPPLTEALARNKKLKWSKRITKLYGVTVEQYDAMGPFCWICGNVETSIARNGKPFRLTVDHHHDSGEVRGLLCRKCNLGLGHFDDDVNRLFKAVAYLHSSRKRQSA